MVDRPKVAAERGLFAVACGGVCHDDWILTSLGDEVVSEGEESDVEEAADKCCHAGSTAPNPLMYQQKPLAASCGDGAGDGGNQRQHDRVTVALIGSRHGQTRYEP
jgi:hypothetical protein